jgi:hypothetical protein
MQRNSECQLLAKRQIGEVSDDKCTISPSRCWVRSLTPQRTTKWLAAHRLNRPERLAPAAPTTEGHLPITQAT